MLCCRMMKKVRREDKCKDTAHLCTHLIILLHYLFTHTYEDKQLIGDIIAEIKKEEKEKRPSKNLKGRDITWYGVDGGS